MKTRVQSTYKISGFRQRAAGAVAVSLLIALAMPGQLGAQDRAKPDQPHQYHHYQLVDVGTFGGPQSFQNLGGIGRGVLNNGGAFGGWADTSVIDPLCFFDFPDCYAAHAFVWQNGAKTDLGLLPGGTNSQVNWISANGLVAGVGDNGQMDPLIGIPQIRGFLGGQNVGVVDVGTLPGAYFANPLANNDAGQIVGYAANTLPDANSMAGLGYQTRAFVWDATNGMHDIGTLPGGTDAMAGVINDAGEVLGWSYINSVASASCSTAGLVLTTHSFLWDKKNGMKDLGSLGGTCTLGLEFNNRGQVVGSSAVSGDAVSHPFVWESGSGIVDLLGASDGNFGNAISINKNGVIVGGSCNAVTCYALLWRKVRGKWQLTNLGQVNGGSFGISINSAEQVIGDANTGTFLWERGGTIVDLSTLVSSGSGLQINEVGMINEQGEISANASDASGNNHDVVLIPCDENHPGVAGCDYSLIDAETAAVRSSQNPAQHPEASNPGNRMPGLWNRRHFLRNRPTPGLAPVASLALSATPATGDLLDDHQLVPQFGTPASYCGITAAFEGVLTGGCFQSTSPNTCNVTSTGCNDGQPATVGGSLVCAGNQEHLISTTKCGSVPGFNVSTTGLTPTTVSAGGSATSTLTVSAYGGFGGSVAFSCSVQPASVLAPTCLFSPRSVTSGTPSTLTVSTTAATSALRTGTGSGLFYAFFLPFGGLFAMVLRFGPQQKRNGKFRAAALACMLFAGVVFQAACGAKTPTPGTPAGQYMITVTGTDSSGTLAIPTGLAFYVQ